MNSKLAINGWLLFIAIIWGFGFVPQKLGMDYLEPGAFNAWRFALGALTLLPIIAFASGRLSSEQSDQSSRSTIKLGALLGGLLFLGALMQQLALLHTSVANVAFITGLYVIIVPAISFFFGVRYAAIVWLGGITAIVGLYLMTGGAQSPSLKGDAIALVGAVMWALHILALSHKAGAHPQIKLSGYQFGFCALYSVMFSLVFESALIPKEAMGYVWPLLNGVVVVGIAYTLQVVVMDKADPFAASVILSLEAVFGALAGYWVFDESFTAAALVGAVLMLVGCLMAQWPKVGKPTVEC